MTRIRVVHNSPGSHTSDAARVAKIRAQPDAQPTAVIDRLARALRATEKEAGDCLESLGCPRTWRKQMRVE